MPQLTKNIFEELSEKVKGDVYTDKIRRYMHSTDGSIFRVEPACVVYPKDAEDVRTIVKFSARYGLSIHTRGAGSGLCGSAIGKGLVMDFTKYMNKLVTLDKENKFFTCEPGYRMGELDVALKGTGLFYPPDPSSGEYATFGGMYATNASGAHSVKYGNIADHIIDAKLILADGTETSILEIKNTPFEQLAPRFKKLFKMYEDNKEKIEGIYPPNLKCNSSGYNIRGLVKDGKLCIDQLLGGSEGTLAIVTELTFGLQPKPNFDSLVVAYFDDIVKSAQAAQRLLTIKPSGIEIMDKSLLNLARESDPKLKDAIPEGIDNVLMIEFDGYEKEEVVKLAEEGMALIKDLSISAEVAANEEQAAKFWAVRKAAVPILYKLKGRKKILALVEDAAVPTDRLVDYFKGIYQFLGDHKVDFVTYGHIAKGLLHTRPLLDLKDPHDIEMLKVLADEMYRLVHSLGGVVSGEHGDGRIRSAYIKAQYGDVYPYFLETKKLFDPEDLLNPDIKTVCDDDQMMKYLRYGSDYRSDDINGKHLVWDEGLTTEAEKCHGCSKCTTVTTATRMCPVYKATRDETAAPKAKANVLRALISGAISDQALYEDAFQNVINKCISCGSCVHECPSNVNIPKLAMEAKGLYADRFGPGLSNRILGNCDIVAKYTHKFSPIINKMMKLKANRKVVELITGVTAERPFVGFDGKSLFDRAKNRTFKLGGMKVMYFSGCYAGYINPAVGEAALDVLEHIGCEVLLPDQVCCGIPLVSKGMPEDAKNRIRKNLNSWGNLIDQVDYIVVTCSSCGLTLLKEWSFMLSSPEVEAVSKKLIHISTLINMKKDKLRIKKKNIKIAYHKSCHMKVQAEHNSSMEMLKGLPGIEVTDMNSGCCGMGGSWGLKADNFEISKKIAEPMLNKLESINPDYGSTDCPTCAIQMEHICKRTIKHPVEVLKECLED